MNNPKQPWLARRGEGDTTHAGRYPTTGTKTTPPAADESTTTLAGDGVGSGDQDEERAEPPTLDTLAREGARRMLMTALEAEVTEYIERFADTHDADGQRLVVRNGQAQERTVTCGAGTWKVRAPRVNDKRVDGDGAREPVHGRAGSATPGCVAPTRAYSTNGSGRAALT